MNNPAKYTSKGRFCTDRWILPDIVYVPIVLTEKGGKCLFCYTSPFFRLSIRGWCRLVYRFPFLRIKKMQKSRSHSFGGCQKSDLLWHTHTHAVSWLLTCPTSVWLLLTYFLLSPLISLSPPPPEMGLFCNSLYAHAKFALSKNSLSCLQIHKYVQMVMHVHWSDL